MVYSQFGGLKMGTQSSYKELFAALGYANFKKFEVPRGTRLRDGRVDEAIGYLDGSGRSGVIFLGVHQHTDGMGHYGWGAMVVGSAAQDIRGRVRGKKIDPVHNPETGELISEGHEVFFDELGAPLNLGEVTLPEGTIFSDAGNLVEALRL